MNPMKARLLIVDDNECMREILREVMHDLCIVEIDEACDGRAALAMFQSNPYDLVLSDWNMPFLSGLELLRAIRVSPVRGDTAVLLLSSEMNAKRSVEALELGVNGVMEKPFRVAKLCDKVQRIIAALAPVTPLRNERHLGAQVV
jgi:two-component system chemotaxis response regulator CheY